MPAGEEDTARAFYVTVLGLTEQPKPPNLAKRGGCWFIAGDLRLHVGVEADFRPARKAHVAFRVEHLAALVRALRTSGATVTEETATQVYVDDPFGSRIELVERLTV